MVAKSGLRADAAAFVPQSKAVLGGALGASVTANAGPQPAQQSRPGDGYDNVTDR